MTKLRRPTQEPRVIWESINTHIALLELDTTFDLSDFILDEARETLKIILCDLAYWQRTELRVVFQLESSSALTKLVRLIDGVEVEDLVTKMGLERCERLRCNDMQWAVIA